MQEITTIFWDLDGTLVDTDTLYDKAIKFACSKASYTTVRSINDIPNGQTLISDFSFVTNNYDLELLKRLEKCAIFYMKENFTNNLVIQNAVELFNYFHSIGLEQSIVSNSNQELCNFIVDKIGLQQCFYSFGIETVKHGKPSPDLYLHALKKHLVSHNNCLVFEDSITGINAARKANIAVISVGRDNSYTWDIGLTDAAIFFSKLVNIYKFVRIDK